jgi:hypothetical protein
MAEIHVQPKRRSSSAWLWIILFLLIIGSVVAFLMLRDENNPLQINKQKQTSSLSVIERNTV